MLVSAGTDVRVSRWDARINVQRRVRRVVLVHYTEGIQYGVHKIDPTDIPDQIIEPPTMELR
jgi:hypothetical protein